MDRTSSNRDSSSRSPRDKSPSSRCQGSKLLLEGLLGTRCIKVAPTPSGWVRSWTCRNLRR